MTGPILSEADRARIHEAVRAKYTGVAGSPAGLFRYPTGRAGLEGLRYDPALVARLPEEVVSSYCGVGNPFSLGPVSEGESVLDVGCGAGVDTLFAAMMAGPRGKAVGVDAVAGMLDRARRNRAEAGVANAAFIEASAEALPFPDASFDLVISNGVLNLVIEKPRALGEMFRVLKPGGRLQVADQVLVGSPPEDAASVVETWFR